MKVARRCQRALVALPLGHAARSTGQATVPRNHPNEMTPVHPPGSEAVQNGTQKGPHQRLPADTTKGQERTAIRAVIILRC